MGSRNLDREQFAGLEAMISVAGEYVYPSDDLRARTLETARESRSIRRGRRRVLSVTLALVLATVISLPGEPAGSRAESQPKPTGADFGDLHQQAIRRSFVGQVDLGWALCEVFAELRRAQALRLGSDLSGSKSVPEGLDIQVRSETE